MNDDRLRPGRKKSLPGDKMVTLSVSVTTATKERYQALPPEKRRAIQTEARRLITRLVG